MIKPILTTLCLTLAAGPALALSCQRPDAAQSFQKAAASSDSYVILNGQFQFKTAPEQPDGKVVKQTMTPSRFEGLLLTGQGFSDEVVADVAVELSCLGQWCGQIKPDIDYLAFVVQTEDTLTFKIDPCYWSAFESPSQEMLATVETCAKGGACAPTN